MTRRSTLPLALAAAFALFVLYTTLVSTPEPLPTGAEHSAAGAEKSCIEAVRQQVPEATFPFDPDVTYRGAARYHLHGYVEAVITGANVRRNYECAVRYASHGYHVDSVRVWQSH